MCRRFVKQIPKSKYRERLIQFLDATDPDEDSKFNLGIHSYNSILGTSSRSITESYARWGLVPKQAAMKKRCFINVSSETVAHHKLFESVFKSCRSVTWATGYYTWQGSGKRKQAYFIHFADQRPFYMYGIWQESKRADRDDTFALLTTRAADNLKPISDRMPCIAELNSADVAKWLDFKSKDVESLQELLRPSKRKLIATKVSSYVNSVYSQGVRCIQPKWETLMLF